MANWWANYITQRARAYGLDPRAVLAVASQEGLGGGVGDQGTSYGPFQLHRGGALPAGRGRQWAESQAGIDYALQRIAGVARGQRGAQAIQSIVSRFERPANPGREIQGAISAYGRGVSSGGGSAPGGVAQMLGTAQQQVQQPGVNPRALLASALITANQASSHGQTPDYSQFGALESAIRQPSVAAAIGPSLPDGNAPLKGDPRGGIRELFYDPSGAFKNGQAIAPVGHHSDHVHVALSSLAAQLNAEREARQLGLRVGQEQNSDVTRVHVPDSYHYRNFPGSRYRQAADVSGSPRSMAAFFKWVARNYR